MNISFCFKKIKQADKQYNKRYCIKIKLDNHYKWG